MSCAVAKSLSPAQRAMLIESGPDDIRGVEGLGVELRSSARYATARALYRRRLGLYSGGDELPGMYWSNEDGLRVRAELLRMSDAPKSDWHALWREAIDDLADERDRTIKLAKLLERCRDEYVVDALAAMNHADGRGLLAEIEIALR